MPFFGGPPGPLDLGSAFGLAGGENAREREREREKTNIYIHLYIYIYIYVHTNIHTHVSPFMYIELSPVFAVGLVFRLLGFCGYLFMSN